MRTCSVEGCGRPIQARGWCFRHDQRMRLFGSLTRKHEPLDREVQRSILGHLRAGLTLRQASEAAGYNHESVRTMVSNGRRGKYPSMASFAREVDLIRLTRPPKRRLDGLTEDGRAFLAHLDRETERSLRDDVRRYGEVRRWRWSSARNMSGLQRE